MWIEGEKNKLLNLAQMKAMVYTPAVGETPSQLEIDDLQGTVVLTCTGDLADHIWAQMCNVNRMSFSHIEGQQVP